MDLIKANVFKAMHTSTPALQTASPTAPGRRVVAVVFVLAGALAFTLVLLTNDPSLTARQRDARAAIRRLDTFFREYSRTLGRYPSPADAFQLLVKAHLIPADPVDPWGHRYVYLLENGAGRVLSYGSDGAPGGHGEAADVSSRGLLPGAPWPAIASSAD